MGQTADKLDEVLTKPVDLPGSLKPLSAEIEQVWSQFGDGSREFLGIRTGFRKFDQTTLGLSGLGILSGVAAAGKTSLALQMLYQAYQVSSDVCCLFISLEMSKGHVVSRIASQVSGLSAKSILRGGRKPEGKPNQHQLNDRDFNKLSEAIKKIGSDRFYIYDRTDGEMDFKRLEEQINTAKTRTGCSQVFVVVDHLQVFDDPELKSLDSYNRAVSSINSFKAIHENTKATILLISQRNKGSYRAKSIEGVKGAGDIIYLADIVMNLDVKNAEEDGIADFEGSDEVSLTINKDRHGGKWSLPLIFHPEITKFDEN